MNQPPNPAPNAPLNPSTARTDNPYSIYRLPEALTCWPAMAVMAAAFLVAALVFALGGVMARVWFGFTLLFAIVAVVVGMAGVSGAGACLSDLARGRPYRGLVGYFMAGLLCLPKLLGGIGGHKFYLNRVGQGLLYLVFCWTFIPAVIAFIEGIVYITMDDERFWQKYG